MIYKDILVKRYNVLKSEKNYEAVFRVYFIDSFFS
jgi:hypothetical protein